MADAQQEPQNPQELNTFVENLLGKLQDRFDDMSKQILGKIDTMGQRIDELEKSIGSLMEQAGLEEQADAASGATATESK